MRCEDVADHLDAAADGSLALEKAERRHVEQCLRCQAELVQYRKVLRAMRALRTEVLEPADGLLADLLPASRRAASGGPSGHSSAATAPPTWAGWRRPPQRERPGR